MTLAVVPKFVSVRSYVMDLSAIWKKIIMIKLF